MGSCSSLNKDLKEQESYSPPTIQIVEVVVEKGFALSDFGEGSDPFAS